MNLYLAFLGENLARTLPHLPHIQINISQNLNVKIPENTSNIACGVESDAKLFEKALFRI